ncbi:prepilin-type N-terminal cleavage/methylation domain-containing protein [Salibacterium salarium]|uniref:Prepilin-type N-terminal cleavage/methylation domain-containing protein n=1 Tax=Salibacterium salarium TaxID=284579 RepID=A0A428N244_9BACI|nr:prepilin-type N-terminal cleavage/methylation domain-containing protein [Salibacterium salarium]RSL32377.1 prepilin-type N-terminal cleavage/methylation domain-containing protein [Salibacterium salarium]
MKKNRCNQTGLTLIEVLASITILSIVTLTFLSFFSQSMIFSERTEDELTAVNAAEKVMNIVKNNPPAFEYPEEVIVVNEKQYYTEVEKSPQNELGLRKVHVKIFTNPDYNSGSKPTSELYGYIEVDE